ncbi:hypothetical protein HOP50_08g50770 [Chloropicon primus]|nr:hypothetical protein HOP50_08g50770 [Chloropicon primus]
MRAGRVRGSSGVGRTAQQGRVVKAPGSKVGRATAAGGLGERRGREVLSGRGRDVAVRAGSPRRSGGGGGRKGKKGHHHHHHQNTPQVEELLALTRKNKLSDFVRALSRYSKEERKSVFESKFLRRTFLDYCKKNGSAKEAYAFLIEADKVDANLVTSSQLAHQENSRGNLIYYDTRMASRVIGVCARGGDSALAQKAMNYLSVDKGLQLDVYMYTGAINACAKKGEVQKACKLFRQSEVEDGLQPDVFMYCALLKVFRQGISNCSGSDEGEGEGEQGSGQNRPLFGGGDRPPLAGSDEASSSVPRTKQGLLEQALEYIDHMQEEGIVGDVVLYNCLISTCGRALNLEKAESYFWEMQSLGVEPNSKTYSILIHACLSAKEGEKALQYFRDAREQSGVINAHLCAQAVQAHAMLNTTKTDPGETLEGALKLYRELEIEGVQIDGVASASLISLASDLGYHDRALEILNAISHSAGASERPPPEPFAVAADMCAKQNDIEGAKGILRQIKDNENFLPNHELGASLINAFSKAGDLVTSFEVLEVFLARGIVPNSYSFSGLLYACACAGLPVLALKLYSLAKNTGSVTNDPSLHGVWCSSVLHAYLKTRREKYLNKMEGTEEGDLNVDLYVKKISLDIDERLAPFKGKNSSFSPGSRAGGGLGGADDTKQEIIGGIKQVYRDAVGKGYKPSVKVLDMMLECMCTNFYMERIQKVPDYSFQDTAPNLDVSEGAGLFETTAFALFEEASELGVLPPCVSQSDLEIKVDFRQLTPIVAEVCLLVLLRSLKRRWDSSQGKHDFKSLLLLLPRPSQEEVEEKEEGSVPLVDRKVKSLLRYIGMEYVMVDKDERYGDDCMLCIVRPKTIKKCLSSKPERSFESNVSLAYGTTQEIRADYYL